MNYIKFLLKFSCLFLKFFIHIVLNWPTRLATEFHDACQITSLVLCGLYSQHFYFKNPVKQVNTFWDRNVEKSFFSLQTIGLGRNLVSNRRNTQTRSHSIFIFHLYRYIEYSILLQDLKENFYKHSSLNISWIYISSEYNFNFEFSL